MDIRVKLPNGQWVPASESQIKEFHKGTIPRLGNKLYGPGYLDHTAIADWNNVKLFLVNREHVSWYKATSYQTWAYFDFLYNDKDRITYVSRDAPCKQGDTIIDLPDVPINIVFSIGRNENGSVYIEELPNSRVRICDNEIARNGYLGFYHRLIDGL